MGRKIAKARRAKQTPHGKQTVKKLMAHGASTSSLELSGDTKLFDRVARKWNVDYGRMIEIYLLTSLAPIPVATLSNRELGNTGQNYLKSLFAVGFQGLLILVCVAIYAVLIQGIATSGDPIGAIWGCMGYSVLLCFCLFKTGSIARSVFSAH